jgi:hypothetical protein
MTAVDGLASGALLKEMQYEAKCPMIVENIPVCRSLLQEVPLFFQSSQILRGAFLPEGLKSCFKRAPMRAALGFK